MGKPTQTFWQTQYLCSVNFWYQRGEFWLPILKSSLFSEDPLWTKLLVFGESESDSCLVMSDSLRLHGCSLPGSFFFHGIFQARILEWVVITFSRGSSWPQQQTWVSCIAGGFFVIQATGISFWYLVFLDYSVKKLYQVLYCFASVDNIVGLYNRKVR